MDISSSTEMPEEDFAADTQDRVPTSSEMDDTLRRLLLRLASIVQAEGCILLLYDVSADILTAQVPAHGIEDEQVEGMEFSATRGVLGSVFVSRKPLIQNDVSDQDEHWVNRWNIRNSIVFPLTTDRYQQQTPMGLLLAFNRKEGAFTEDDLQVLTVMSRQLTAVLTDASMFLQFNKEKEQLQATLLSLGNALVMVEVSGRISLINDVAARILGSKARVGAFYENAIEDPKIVQLLKTTIHSGEEQQQEIEVKLPDSNRTLVLQTQTALVRNQHWHYPRTIGAVAVFNDITEIRNVERLKTSFVSAVSHELRTPLTSIKGFVATLLQDTEGYFDVATQREFYEIIDNECDRLRRLIDDLLSVSRIEAGRSLEMRWSQFSPLKIAIRVVRAHKPFGQGNKLILDSPKDLPNMNGDADKFEQILNNILSNAIKYSPHGGEIRLILRAENDHLLVTVRDQGIGIPSDKLERIFAKFERVDNSNTRSAGGTGIGLFLVKHLTEQHGGRVWAESELGKGSDFHLDFPLNAQADAEDNNTIEDFVK